MSLLGKNMKPENESPQLYSFEEAAKLAGNSHWAWRLWASRGLITTVRLGRRRMIPVVEVHRICTEGLKRDPQVGESDVEGK